MYGGTPRAIRVRTIVGSDVVDRRRYGLVVKQLRARYESDV